jgi:uncharacterized protein with HEPN domain
MNVSPEQAGFLWDILVHARDIQSHLAGLSKEDYLKDRKTQHAVERCLEIMGEAAGQLHPETITQIPNLPVRPMREMRNFLIHVYFSIDLGRVWNTCHENIPEVIASLESFEQSLPKDS